MAFVKEKIPQSFLDSFDINKLFVPYGKGWPIRTWTHDKERDVAWIPITTDSNVATDEGRPTRTWYTMILEGHVIGVLAEDGGEELPEKDPQYQRNHEIATLENTQFLVPNALKGREQEIVRLAEEAFYVAIDGPETPWVKGVKINGAGFGSWNGPRHE